MKRNRVIYKIKFTPNIEGWENYKFKDIYPSVIKDYQNGMKVKDICDKYSIGHTTLNNYLRRFNIPRHT